MFNVVCVVYVVGVVCVVAFHPNSGNKRAKPKISANLSTFMPFCPLPANMSCENRITPNTYPSTTIVLSSLICRIVASA